MPEPNPRLLLVEGPDDKHVVQHLMRVHEVPLGFEISEAGGIRGVLDAIPVQLQVDGRITLGVLVDANDDIASRWQSLSDVLREAGYRVPKTPSPAGIVIDGPDAYTPKIGVWLMPDNEAAGELEDFVRDLVPQTDPVWPRAVDYVDSISTTDRQFAERKEMRAKLHAWLAVRQEPRLMGAAIGRGDLDAQAPNATALIGWLRRVFGASSAGNVQTTSPSVRE